MHKKISFSDKTFINLRSSFIDMKIKKYMPRVDNLNQFFKNRKSLIEFLLFNCNYPQNILNPCTHVEKNQKNILKGGGIKIMQFSEIKEEECKERAIRWREKLCLDCGKDMRLEFMERKMCSSFILI